MMPLLLLFLAVPVGIWLVNMVLNVLARVLKWHRGPHSTPFITAAFLNGAVLPLFLVISEKGLKLSVAEMVCGLVYLLLYVNGLLFFNWFVFTVTDVSMHIHLLVEIGRRGSTPMDTLKALYNKQAILKARIPRLIELRQLRMENDRLFLNGLSVLLGAWGCNLLRRILGIPARPEEARSLQRNG